MRKPVRTILLALAAFMLFVLMAACDDGGETTIQTYAYDPGEAFTTNFVTPGEKKILKCSVIFEVTDEKSIEAMLEKNYIIRDAVIKELGRLTIAEATESKDLDALSHRLVAAVNAALETDIFYSAYFNEFTVA